MQLNMWKFFQLNFLNKNVKRDKGKYIFPYKNSVIDIHKTATIQLHASLYICQPEAKGENRQTILYIRENGRLVVNGELILCSGATIQIQHNASISIGKAYVNHDATIIAANSMKIGNEILISRNVVIFDSDFHKIFDGEGKQVNVPRDVEIGNHVWIGVNATLLRGSKIGDGAVIAAGAVVGGKIKAGTMAAGSPARSYSEIYWEA